MAYREGNRNQIMMFPPSIEEMIEETDSVRIYDEFVEQLDIESIGLKLNNKKEGNPEYHPKAMLKVLLYGYSYGIRSSRRIERALHHNITFMWLSGGLKPDHKTISLFRKRNRSALKEMFRKCVELCIKLNVVEGNTLYVDGSKVRANAGMKNSFTKVQAKERMAQLDRRISRMLKECDLADKQEEDQGSWIKLQESLSTAKKRRAAIAEALDGMADKDEIVSSNLTDPECRIMAGRQGSHASYNVQIVTDDQHGLIVGSDVVSDGNDNRQLKNQLEKASDLLGKNPEVIVADKGYSNRKDFDELTDAKIGVVVPPIQYACTRAQSTTFPSSAFNYHEQNDTYQCPSGHFLHPISSKKIVKTYRITNAKLCQNCPHFGICTTSRRGRYISRHENESVFEKIRAFYYSEKGQAIYRFRGQKIEHVFGHFKKNLGVSSFLLRGRESAIAELAILSTCFNLRRLATILGPRFLFKAT